MKYNQAFNIKKKKKKENCLFANASSFIIITFHLSPASLPPQPLTGGVFPPDWYCSSIHVPPVSLLHFYLLAQTLGEEKKKKQYMQNLVSNDKT